jgi:hypothetical protein
MAYDSIKQKVVLFGGEGGPGIGPLNDTWEWDSAAWVQVADTGPSGRRDHAYFLVELELQYKTCLSIPEIRGR